MCKEASKLIPYKVGGWCKHQSSQEGQETAKEGDQHGHEHGRSCNHMHESWINIRPCTNMVAAAPLN